MLFVLRILTLSLLALSPLALCSRLAQFTDININDAAENSGNLFDAFKTSGIDGAGGLDYTKKQGPLFTAIGNLMERYFTNSATKIPKNKLDDLLDVSRSVADFTRVCTKLIAERARVVSEIGKIEANYRNLDIQMKILLPNSRDSTKLIDYINTIIGSINTIRGIDIVGGNTYMSALHTAAGDFKQIVTNNTADLAKSPTDTPYQTALLAVEKEWHKFYKAAAIDLAALKADFDAITLALPTYVDTYWERMRTQLDLFVIKQNALVTFINGLKKDGAKITTLGNNIKNLFDVVTDDKFTGVFIGKYKADIADIFKLFSGTTGSFVAASELKILQEALEKDPVDLESVSTAATALVTISSTILDTSFWADFPGDITTGTAITPVNIISPADYKTVRYTAVSTALNSICTDSVNVGDVCGTKSTSINDNILIIEPFLSSKLEFIHLADLKGAKTTLATKPTDIPTYKKYRKALSLLVKAYDAFFHKSGYLTVTKVPIVFLDLQTELDLFFAEYALLQKTFVDGIGNTVYPGFAIGSIDANMNEIQAAIGTSKPKVTALTSVPSIATKFSTFLSNSAPNEGLSELITEIKAKVNEFSIPPSGTTKLKAYLVMCNIVHKNLLKIEALWDKLYTDVKSVDNLILKPTTQDYVLTNVNFLLIIYKTYAKAVDNFIIQLNQMKDGDAFDTKKVSLDLNFKEISDILDSAPTFGIELKPFSDLFVETPTKGPVKIFKGLLDTFVTLAAYDPIENLKLKEEAALAFSKVNFHDKFGSLPKIDGEEVQTLSSAHKKFFDALKLVVDNEIKTVNPDSSSKDSFKDALEKFITLVKGGNSWDCLGSYPSLKTSIANLDFLDTGELALVNTAFKTALNDSTLLGNLQDAMCALVSKAKEIWTTIYSTVTITQPGLPVLTPLQKAIGQVDNTVTKNSATQFDPVHEIFKNFHTAADAYFKNPNGEGLLVTLTSKFEVITKHPELDVSKYPTNAAGEVGVVKALMVPGETDKLKVGNVFDLDAVKAFFVKVNSALAALVNKTDGTFTAFPEIVVTQNNQQLSPVTSRKYYEDIVGVWNGIVADVELKIGGTGPEVAAFESKIDGLMNGAKVVSVDESALAPKRSTLLRLVTALLDSYKGQNTTKDIPGLRTKAIAVKGGLDTYFNGIAHGSNLILKEPVEVITDGEGQKADNTTVKGCYNALLAPFNELVNFINKMEGDPTANKEKLGELVGKIKELISSHKSIHTAEKITGLGLKCDELSELKNVTNLNDLKDKVNAFGTELKNTYEGLQATEGKEIFASPSLCTSEKPKEKGGVSGEPNTSVEDNDSKFKTLMDELTAMYEELKTKLSEIKTGEDVTSKQTSILGLFGNLREKLKGENLTEDQKKDPDFVEMGSVVEGLNASFSKLEKKEITVDEFKIALKEANRNFEKITENLRKKTGKYSIAVVVGIVVGSLAGGIFIIVIIVIVIRKNGVGNEMDLENQKGSSNEGK